MCLFYCWSYPLSRLRSDVTDPDNPDRHSGHVGIKTKKAADKMIQPPSLFLCPERRLFRKDVVLETYLVELDDVVSLAVGIFELRNV